MKGMMIGCVIMALMAAAVYLLTGDSTSPVPAVNSGTAHTLLISVAGDCYALGALMILVRRRWLWMAGLAINTLVIAACLVIAVVQQPEIALGTPAMAALVPEILLEAGLAFLVFAHARIPQLGFEFRSI